MVSFPSAFDDDLTLPRVDNNISEIGGDAINSLRDAIIAIERSMGTNAAGNLSSLVDRVNQVIDDNGNIKSSALQGKGLVSLPITNNQIADDAGILESKLDLDFPTSTLNSNIAQFSNDVDSLRTNQTTLLVQTTAHYAGVSNRHDGYKIDLRVPILGVGTVEEAINIINDEFNSHLTSGNAHQATTITVVDNFNAFDATTVQEAFEALDQISVSSLSHHQDELRNTSIASNKKGQFGIQGNLPETILASTIYQTNATTTNILQVMRPDVARITSLGANLRALKIGFIQNLRFQAGGVGRGTLDVNLSSVIPTDNIDDLVRVINTTAANSHYPLAAYNTNGNLTVAHNLAGDIFTIQVLNTISQSAASTLGFDTDLISWASDNYSAFIGGQRVSSIQPRLRTTHIHDGASSITLDTDLTTFGIPTGAEGRTLANITDHSNDTTFNGTYYITSFVDNFTFMLADGTSDPITIPAGTFTIEFPADSLNFQNSTNGEIWDIFAEAVGDGYSAVITKTRRASYGVLSNVAMTAISPNFPNEVSWQVSNASSISFLGAIEGDASPATEIPTGYIGELKVWAPDNYNFALFQVVGNPSSGVRSVSISDFAGNNERLYLSSIHYAGTFGIKTLRFITDRRNFGGSFENTTNDPFTPIFQETAIADLRSNGVIRGLDVISTDTDSFTIRGGRAYVGGRAVDVATQTVSLDQFSAATYTLLLDRYGKLFVRSEFDAGYALNDLENDDRGVAILYEFQTDGTQLIDGYGVDRRLIIGDLDRLLNNEIVALNTRCDQIQAAASGSFWAQMDAYQDGATSSLGVSTNSGFIVLDQPGFASGNNLITTRRFQFTNITEETFYRVFKSVGLTHLNVMLQVEFTGNSGGPFGTSGLFTLDLGIGVELGRTTPQIYELYATAKTISSNILPSSSVIERYVVSIPLASIGIPDNCFINAYPRVRIQGSTFADGGSGPDTSPLINFSDVRIVSSSYSIAANILGSSDTDSGIATVIGDIL